MGLMLCLSSLFAKGLNMLDAIILTGQLFVGFIAIIVAVSVVVAFFLEAYDRITGADTKRQAEKERLRYLEEEL